jgi:predicted dehydrogenase
MAALLGTRAAEAVGICDPNAEMAREAQALAPHASLAGSLEELLALSLDGIVIATPNALHAEQCMAALEVGVAVFCQKPLGRNAVEVEAVLSAARDADRLLGVDLSYRHTAAMQAIRDRVRNGELGHIFAADLVFHNAYGPQSGWFWDPRLSGGGCLIDLGVHLVDLALWMLDFPEVVEARATLLREGRSIREDEVEDYAVGELNLAGGTTVRLACSWNLDAGQDADISARFYGTKAGAEMRNENGSFFDFWADLLRGRERERLASPPDAWAGRAAVDWLMRLDSGERFDGTTTGLLETARVLDRLYAAVGHHDVERSAERPARPGERLIKAEGRARPEEIDGRRVEPARQAENTVAPVRD